MRLQCARIAISEITEPLARRFPMVGGLSLDDIESTGQHPFQFTQGVTIMIASAPVQYQLRFRSLFNNGRGFSFPCNPQGQVDLDNMSERLRDNYFYARAIVGRELSVPAVEVGVVQ